MAKDKHKHIKLPQGHPAFNIPDATQAYNGANLGLMTGQTAPGVPMAPAQQLDPGE